MKTCQRRIFAMLLCIALCVSMVIPAYALEESNTQGVVFNVALDTPEIDISSGDQTVVMRLTASKEISVDGIAFTVVWDDALTLTSITGGDKLGAYSAAATNLTNGKAYWGSPDMENVTGVTELAVITFTVPAGTAANTYNVGVEALELTSDYGSIWEDSAHAQTVLTIREPEAAAGYTASLSALTTVVNVEGNVSVNIGVSHDKDAAFAAGEVILTYDDSLLQFNEENSTLGAATVKDDAGTLILEDYGADKNFGTGVYVLSFDAIADGEATVTITEAAFVDKDDAVKSDLIAADITTASVAIVIEKQVHNVTLPEIFTGPASVVDGEDYTFSVADGSNYDYDEITATIDGQPVDVIDNGDGTYTIEGATGAIVITGTRTEKSYTVTVTGNAAADITDASATATYNTPYSFTIPTAEGWAYSLDSITIGGNAYTGYSVSDSVYTIPGTAITGDVVITVIKTQTSASVTVEGSGAGAAAGYEVSATIGQPYTLTITPEAGYTYTVTAKMNGQPVAVVDNGDNTYTIANVTGSIVFTVDRSVVVEGVFVSQFLTLDGSIMWLVRNNVEVADGKVPTYDGAKMFKSEKYGTYCYLVIAETLTNEEAAAKTGIIDGTCDAVDYGMDVNKTSIVDAADAQLVYNMYNAVYSEFAADVTVEKFLRADVNADGEINVDDAVAIIEAILS